MRQHNNSPDAPLDHENEDLFNGPTVPKSSPVAVPESFGSRGHGRHGRGTRGMHVSAGRGAGRYKSLVSVRSVNASDRGGRLALVRRVNTAARGGRRSGLARDSLSECAAFELRANPQKLILASQPQAR